MAFESLSEKLQGVFKNLRSKGRLTEDDVKAAMREVKRALLEADVNFKVVKTFIKSVQERAVGQDVLSGLNPGQMVIKIVKEEMEALMGSTMTEIQLRPGNEITIILMAGLQGAGKTTTCAKLAGQYKKKGKRPLLVILDTAGRLHIDENMMTELIEIKDKVDVFQSILVVDAMTGQDAVNVAKEFNEKVGIDGVIITKMDGDTRGGAALSIRSVTGKPILYVGMGEKLEDLQQFYPDRMTSRILGMGDVLSLIEKAEQTINEEDALRMTEKMKKAEFDFNDFLDQMDQMKKMGGLSNLLSMIPGIGNKMQGLDIDDGMMDKTAAIIYSMTKEERANPKIINASRKRRIAAGAGVPLAEVNRLCKQVQNQKQMMKQMSGMFGGKGGKRGGFKLPF